MNNDTTLAKDIAITGYTTSPSERQCADGELSCSYNMVNEDGAMSPIMNPVEVCSGTCNGIRRGFIHTVEGGKRKNLVVIACTDNRWTARFYIGVQDYLSAEHDAASICESSDLEIPLLGDVAVAAVGNTLVLTSHQEKHYILWKIGEGVEGSYIYLGNDIPTPSMSLKLISSSSGTEWYYTYPEEAEDRDVPVQCLCTPSQEAWTSEENQMAIHNAVMAMCNKFVAECHQKGRFMFPFLVRYAWRMFDGTLTKHSAPILMLPSSRVAPIVDVDWDQNSRVARCTPKALCSYLHYNMESPLSDEVRNWKDIITSLEIFVSPPLYSYRQDVNSFDDDDFNNYTPNQEYNPDSFGVASASYANQAWYYGNFISGSFFVPPHKSVKDMRQQIEECSTFHLLFAINLDDPNYAGRTLTRDQVGNLENLVSREAMTDDYDSRDSVKGQRVFSYNNRISLANISKTLYGGGLPRDVSAQVYDNVNECAYQVYFFVKTSSGVSVVTSGGQGGISAMVPYLYYPNMGCYKAVIKRTENGVSRYMEVPMRPHKFLNGSLWVAEPETLMPSVAQEARLGGFIPGWFTPSAGDYSSLTATTTDILLPNKIYTSEVDNPFVTMVTNIATVGQGEILGISTAAKALSQGQFGQFPLYAFSSDGVWALSVSSSGGFSSVQPITQDVCTNPDSITQLDSSVVFATKRGLMQLTGSSAECITERISAIDPYDLSALPGMAQLHTLLGHVGGDGCIPTRPFNDYLKESVMIYDYVHQRLYLGNPNYDYTYVYSLKGSQWGWFSGCLSIPLNSYPNALAFLNRNDTTRIHDFSADNATDNRTLRNGLMITRALKLDSPDTLKTISSVYLRGLFRPANVGIVLWGSRDLQNWYLLGSSNKYFLEGIHGDGYKFFRIGVKSSLYRGDRITGMSVAFTPKLNNRIR